MQQNIEKYNYLQKIPNRIPTVKKLLSFKLIIPPNVQKKIDLTCLKINNIEWSGSLFYDYEGSWKNNDLIITVRDLFLQDIGDAGSTTFEITPDVVRYRIDNDLLDAQVGLIHSHHNMAAFFSGTDMNTLESEALEHNHFLSLIVNNKRDYVAAITSVVEVKRSKVVTEDKEYMTFNGVKELISNNTFNETEEVKIIEYVPLEIIIQDYENSNQDLIDRIAELQAIKRTTTKGFFPNGGLFNNTEYKQGNLFSNDTSSPFFNSQTNTKEVKEEKEEIIKSDDKNITISKETIEYKVKQLLTLSRILPFSNNVNVNKLISSLDVLYKNKFYDLHHFKAFISWYIEELIVDPFIINLKENELIEEELLTSDIALAMLDFIANNGGAEKSNEYLQIIVEELESFIYI